MSKKYKDAMDKIVVSDELKAKISAAAAKKIAAEKSRSHRSKMVYMRRAASLAACFVLCVTAVSVSKRFNETNIPPSYTPSPKVTQAPDTYTNTDKNTEKNTDAENHVSAADGSGRAEAADTAAEPPAGTVKSWKSVKSAKPEKSNTDKTETAQINKQPSDTDINGSMPLPPPADTDAPLLSGQNPTDDDMPETSGGGVCAAPNIEGMELSEIRKEAGYDFKIPFYIPQGYEMSDTSLMFGSMVQILYEKGENRLIYRTDNTNEDISGDYNVYENTEEEKIGGADVTIKGNDDKYNSAVWNDTNAYSVYSDEGLDKSEMIKIIESTDYPSFNGETENNGETQTEN